MATTLKEQDTKRIQSFILHNHALLDNKDMAMACNTTEKIIAANRLIVLKNNEPKKIKKVIPKVKIKEEIQNNYNATNCAGKKEAQKIINKWISKSNIIGLILTLPYIYCIIEKAILKNNNKFKFIGVERYKDTYDKMRKTIKKDNLPIVPYHGMISDKIYGVKKNTYAHLILDYCGNLSSFLDELIYVFKYDIVKLNGFVCLTFAKPIIANSGTHKTVKDNGRFLCNNVNDNRGLCEKAIEKTIDKISGMNYKTVEIFYYNDDKIDEFGNKHSGMPMVLVILKRIK